MRGGRGAQGQTRSQRAKGTGTRADALFGNISHESLELECIQEDLQHLEVFIFLVSPSNVFL